MSRTHAISRLPPVGSQQPSDPSPARSAAATAAEEAAAKVAELHGKVRRQRLDHAHKTALALVRDHDVIVHEGTSGQRT